jgi:hypothetical protein
MLAAFRIFSALIVATLAYVWTVGQAGLETANRNICQLVGSFITLSACEVHYWFVGLWIAGLVAALSFIAVDFARFAKRAATPYGGVVLFCHHYRDAVARKFHQAWSNLEPSHVIILGLVVALGGAIWQWSRVPSSDPRIAEMQKTIADLQKQPAVQSNPRLERLEKEHEATVAELASAKQQLGASRLELENFRMSKAEADFQAERNARPTGNPLLDSINSFLAKSGKKGRVGPMANQQPDGFMIGDAGDGRGPFIAFWGTGLGPWPKVSDGFTEDQLRGSPDEIAKPARKLSAEDANKLAPIIRRISEVIVDKASPLSVAILKEASELNGTLQNEGPQEVFRRLEGSHKQAKEIALEIDAIQAQGGYYSAEVNYTIDAKHGNRAAGLAQETFNLMRRAKGLAGPKNLESAEILQHMRPEFDRHVKSFTTWIVATQRRVQEMRDDINAAR